MHDYVITAQSWWRSDDWMGGCSAGQSTCMWGAKERQNRGKGEEGRGAYHSCSRCQQSRQRRRGGRGGGQSSLWMSAGQSEGWRTAQRGRMKTTGGKGWRFLPVFLALLGPPWGEEDKEEERGRATCLVWRRHGSAYRWLILGLDHQCHLSWSLCKDKRELPFSAFLLLFLLGLTGVLSFCGVTACSFETLDSQAREMTLEYRIATFSFRLVFTQLAKLKTKSRASILLKGRRSIEQF